MNQQASGRVTEPTATVVTVADLLNRYSSGPATGVTPPAPAGTTVSPVVSVDALLRREGLPVPDRAPYDHLDQERPRERTRRRLTTGVVARRSAVAAGTLLAAGSLLGAVVVDTAAERPTDVDAAQGSTPASPAVNGIIPSVPEQGGVLDPGVDAPTEWLTVAFPSTNTSYGAGSADTSSYAGGSYTGGSYTSGTGSSAGGGERTSAPTQTSTGAQTSTQRDTTAQRSTGGTSTAGGSSTDQGSSGSSGGSGGNGLGTAVPTTGDAVGGTAGGVVSGVGGTVSAVGGGVAQTGAALGDDSVVGGAVGATTDLVGSLLG